MGARSEAEEISNSVCSHNEPYSRCDNLTWLKDLDSQGEMNMRPAFSKIAKAMTAFRPILNAGSQVNSGDKTQRVDKEEIVLTRFNGASTREQKYRRHKDSYIRNKNNEIHGMELRKISMIIFLNDNLDQVDEQKGMLRLYPKGDSVEGVVDISPRLGRAVLFKSEEMLH